MGIWAILQSELVLTKQIICLLNTNECIDQLIIIKLDNNVFSVVIQSKFGS